MNTTIPPYYHPTTTCFIDDNEAFLRSIELGLPAESAYISFYSPQEALAAINKPDELPPLVDRCFTMDGSQASNPIIHLNLSALEREITQIQRFKRISVLFVDYAMPSLNGIDLCAAVRNKDIKKVLLTGVADETTAVRAFNDGLIDRYLPKAELSGFNTLVPLIEQMQTEFFQQYSARLSSNLAINPPLFLIDQSISNQFFRILKQHNIVEYFMVSDPYGYLLLRSDGTMYRLVIQSSEENNTQLAIAKKFGAPPGFIEKLQSKQFIAFFSERPEHYMASEEYPWHEMLYPAEHISGDNNWHVALVDDPPADIDFDPARSSFDQYLLLEHPRA